MNPLQFAQLGAQMMQRSSEIEILARLKKEGGQMERVIENPNFDPQNPNGEKPTVTEVVTVPEETTFFALVMTDSRDAMYSSLTQMATLFK